jgi:2-methylcitrate dehydratase PrpD
MNETKTLAAFCANLSFDGLSEDVIDQVKYLTLDFVGLAARGSILDSSKPIHEVIREISTGEDATIIGQNKKASAQYAALANGSAAHSLEMDDVNNESSLHPAVAVFPAALALAEKHQAGGRDVIESVVAGYEVMVRAGKALDPTSHYAQGFHPTGTAGTFGAAAAAAKILNASADEFAHAFGICGSQAAGSMEFLTEGTWTKRLHPGWAAQSGMFAAQLAKAGFLGPGTIFEGEKGFLRAYSSNPDARQLTDALGETYAVMRTSIKAHACCRYKQGPLDLILKIVNQYDLQPDDIRSIKIGLVKTAFPIVAEPYEQKINPQSVVDAQFSMPYGAAVAVIYRRTWLEQYSEDVLHNAEVKKIMKKVDFYTHERLNQVFPKKWPAEVEIETTSGQIYREHIDFPKGDPENPLSWEEMIDKFRYLASSAYSDKRQDDIISTVRNLEELKSIRELMQLL